MAPGSAERPKRLFHQRFAVEFEYPVVFTEGVLRSDNDALAWTLARLEPQRRHRVTAVIDRGVDEAWPTLRSDLAAYAAAHADQMELVDEPLVVPGGEAAKNDPALVTALQQRFQNAKLDRHAYVLIIGGGAVLDVVGYAAALTHRGLRVIRVPTTVLAQNDAGIGVKNGVNAFGTKNFLGTFAAPAAVINDIDFIATLQARDRAAGVAEAVKVSLIRDADFFGWLESRREALAASDRRAMEEMINRCAELHLLHIRSSGDPFETGSARPLDFGHWSAHKLEALSGHALRHGEAVAVGIALDTRYSAATGRLGEPDVRRVCDLLEGVGLQLWHEALEQRDAAGRLAVLAGLDEFREHLGGELTVTLLSGIGRGVEVHEIDEPAMCESIAWLRARHEG